MHSTHTNSRTAQGNHTREVDGMISWDGVDESLVWVYRFTAQPALKSDISPSAAWACVRG